MSDTVTFVKLFSLYDALDPFRSKSAGIYEGSDGRIYFTDGKTPMVAFQQGTTGSMNYDAALEALVVTK